MRCDLHVHTVHSGMCTVPLLRAVCRESYNERRARHGLRRLCLTRDVLAIGAAMARENPAGGLLAPLGFAVPLVTLGNYARESIFARTWMARYRRERMGRAVYAPEPAVEGAV